MQTHRRPAIGFKEYETAARALKIQLQSLEVRGPNPDFEGAFQSCGQGARLMGSSRLRMPCSHVPQSGLRTLP